MRGGGIDSDGIRGFMFLQTRDNDDTRCFVIDLLLTSRAVNTRVGAEGEKYDDTYARGGPDGGLCRLSSYRHLVSLITRGARARRTTRGYANARATRRRVRGITIYYIPSADSSSLEIRDKLNVIAQSNRANDC